MNRELLLIFGLFFGIAIIINGANAVFVSENEYEAIKIMIIVSILLLIVYIFGLFVGKYKRKSKGNISIQGKMLCSHRHKTEEARKKCHRRFLKKLRRIKNI